MSAIKRFYTDVSLMPADGQKFAVALDGKTAKTAGRNLLAAPFELAEALAEEWRAQGDEIRLAEMPLTRLQGFALDADDEGRADWAATIIRYAETDLLCYRAAEPPLAERQNLLFAPFLERAAEEGLHFQVTEGLIPIPQPAATIDALHEKLSGLQPSLLFARKLLTEILGSALLGLYADERTAEAFAAARLDETAQAEQWGRDAEAEEREAALRRDYEDVLRFLKLSGISAPKHHPTTP